MIRLLKDLNTAQKHPYISLAFGQSCLPKLQSQKGILWHQMAQLEYQKVIYHLGHLKWSSHHGTYGGGQQRVEFWLLFTPTQGKWCWNWLHNHPFWRRIKGGYGGHVTRWNWGDHTWPHVTGRTCGDHTWHMWPDGPGVTTIAHMAKRDNIQCALEPPCAAEEGCRIKVVTSWTWGDHNWPHVERWT